MAWIELHQSLIGHRKVLAMSDRLDMDEAHAYGHLVCLWLWAVDHTKHGYLNGMTPRMLSRVMQYRGDEQALYDVMLSVGFIDAREDGLHLHDWQEYAGRLEDIRAKNAERKRLSRARHADVTSPSQGYQTKPDQTKQYQDTTPDVIASDSNGNQVQSPADVFEDEVSSEDTTLELLSVPDKPIVEKPRVSKYSPEFEEFWAIYPYRGGIKQATLNAWNKLMKLPKADRPTPQDLIRAASNYAKFCKSEGTLNKFMKRPNNFLDKDDLFFQTFLDDESASVVATPVASGPPSLDGLAQLEEYYAREDAKLAAKGGA